MSQLLIALAVTVGAPALKDKPSPQDLYGEWQFEQPQAPGTPGAGEFVRYRFNRDGTWQVFQGDRELAAPRGFRFDPAGRPPTVDFNTDPGGRRPTVLGIYKVDGDRLTICDGYPPDPRPGDFVAGPGGGRYVQKLVRVKPKD